MNNTQLWNNFLNILKTRIQSVSFDAWFKDTKLLEKNNGKCIIEVPMEFHKSYLSEHYIDIIDEILNDLTGNSYDYEFVVEADLNQNNNIENSIENTHKKINSNLNKNYTFDNFIVGESNSFAQITALAVAEKPGTIYNPFFLYGKSGLGKTHLMHAIGNYIEETSNKKVLYVTSDNFKDDFIELYRKDSNDDNFSLKQKFKDKYRNLDVLIIDDIQFLTTATKSQEEFFNIFNELHENKKQIIISSDSSPNDLKLLEDRLVTRFKWGLTANINPPDFDLKCKILKNKMFGHEVANLVDDDVIEYIASNCENDVRHLEGAITRLYAYAAIMGTKAINLEFSIEALKDYFGTSIYVTNNIEKIQKAVADYFKLQIEDLKSKKRTANINNARQIAMYICNRTTEETLEKIGLEFGGKDHSTVIHSCNKIENELKNNNELKNIIEQIKNKIEN